MKKRNLFALSLGVVLGINPLLASGPIAPFFEQDSGVDGASGLVKSNRLREPLAENSPGHLVNAKFRLHGKYEDGRVINVKPNLDGNFIFPAGSDEELATSTYATVDYVFALQQQDLEYLAAKHPENGRIKAALAQWNEPTVGSRKMDAIWIDPQDRSNTNNAFYSRYLSPNRTIFYRDLNFFPFSTTGYSSHSFDIVAHETGHAVLDVLHPEYFSQSTVFNGAYHEAYGDITAFLSLMRQETMAKKIMEEMSEHDGALDLRKVTYVHRMAENFGRVFGDTALRNLDKNVHVLKAGRNGRMSTEVHDLSGPISGAIYDATANVLNLFMRTQDFSAMENAQKYKVVIDAGESMSRLLHLWGAQSKVDFTFEDMGKELSALAVEHKAHTSFGAFDVHKEIEDAFTVRGMMGAEAAGNMDVLANSRAFS